MNKTQLVKQQVNFYCIFNQQLELDSFFKNY